MSTRKLGILQRLTRSGPKTKQQNKGSVQSTEVQPTSLHEQNNTNGLHDSPINRTFSNISDFPQSSTSSVSDSNMTMASDLMKCLNNLRIQAVSVTNSTPSVSSIPRLAPPPTNKSLSSECDKIDTTLPRLKSKFSQRSDSARVSMSESKDENFQTTPTASWVEFNHQVKAESIENKSIEEEDFKEGEIMFEKSSLELNLDDVLRKFGSPVLELVERVDVCFSGTEINDCSISGEVKFKLSNSGNRSAKLTTASVDFLENFDFLLTMKHVLQGTSLKNIMVKKSLRESKENLNSKTQEGALDSKNPSTMNKAKDGVLESRNLHLNLGKCYQEALDNPTTLLKYSAQPSALCSPPLSVQIHWVKSEESKFQVLVDVVLEPNRKLGMTLWGVHICLKGFEKISNNNNHFQIKDANTSPQAKWNPSEYGFEWCLPMIHPMDPARHLSVSLNGEIGVISERDLTASIKFVIPHGTVSGTSLIGWIDPKPRNEFEAILDEVHSHDSTSNLKNKKSEPSSSDSFSIFCQKVCLSGDYKATVKY